MKNLLISSKAVYWIVVGFIITLSFIYFSPLTSYIFHSDIGVQVLMTYDFKCPENLYYWNQDRLGSIVPLVGHVILKCLNLSPIVSVSISEYIFLTIGFLSLATLFRTTFSKIIFAIAWFLPSLAFGELVQLSQPYAAQASFLGVMIFFINRSIKSNQTSIIKSLLFLFAGILSLFISIWISDMSWIAYLLLIVVGLFLFLGFNKIEKGVFIIRFPKISRHTILFVTVFILATYIGFSFIDYAKENAIKDETYSNHIFSSLTESLLIINTKFEQIYRTLIFKCGDILLSWHAVFFMTGLFVFFYFLLTKKATVKSQVLWRNYFLFYTILCAILLFCSHWVFANFMVNRYFTVLYISIWLLILISIERFEGKKLLLLQSLFLVSTLFSALSSMAPMLYQGKTCEVKRLNEFKKLGKLGKIGIIGDYWHSYNISAIDPASIKATPNEKDQIRCKSCIDSVLACSTIYLVENSWLDSLPLKTKQFGIDLIRKEKPFEIAGFRVAPYSKMNVNRRFSLPEMSTAFGKVIVDSASFSKNVFYTDAVDVSSWTTYFAFGPYVSLSKASYTVRFALKTADIIDPNLVIAKLDVSYDQGNKKIISREIKGSDFSSTDQYTVFELKFVVHEALTNVEFRVIYENKQKLWFDYVEINQQRIK